MVYEKIGFSSGDVLTAAQMNHIEAGIAAEAEVEAKFFYETATQNNIQPLFFVADIEYET